MITLEQIQQALRAKGFSVAQATSNSAAVGIVSELIAKEVPPLLQQAGLGIVQVASNPDVLERAAELVHKKVPIPWRWVIGKKGALAIVKMAAKQVGQAAAVVVSRTGATTSTTAATSAPDLHTACASCGTILENGSRYCDECGTPVRKESQQPCRQCGAALAEQTPFCAKCGTPRN